MKFLSAVLAVVGFHHSVQAAPMQASDTTTSSVIAQQDTSTMQGDIGDRIKHGLKKIPGVPDYVPGIVEDSTPV
ncbi:hypothetical protein CDD83_6702 [Cordyceps sp. RAO-2017]|nr:hypothetical protein CDD83_6702 [Cordyceps sp. RAO-2017]